MSEISLLRNDTMLIYQILPRIVISGSYLDELMGLLFTKIS